MAILRDIVRKMLRQLKLREEWTDYADRLATAEYERHLSGERSVYFNRLYCDDVYAADGKRWAELGL